MGATDQTLLEQYGVTNLRIEQTKALFGIDREDERAMVEAKPQIEEHLDAIIDGYYARLLQDGEVESLIGDADTLGRLRRAMRGYLQELFGGRYDGVYVTHRLQVGVVHKRIGVSPALYMAAVSTLTELLIDVVHRTADRRSRPAEVTARSLRKLLSFDVQFTFDTYLNSLVREVERTKAQIEKHAADLQSVIDAQTADLRHLVRTDELTGLLNHRAFNEELRRDVAKSGRSALPLSLVYFDLNGFKQLNDTAGHTAGDQALAEVGASMLATARQSDTPCRYGGDEFCTILTGTSAAQAGKYVRRLIAQFEQTEVSSTVSFSIGIAESTHERPLSADDLLREADRRMYIAKERARTSPGHWICDDGVGPRRVESESVDREARV